MNIIVPAMEQTSDNRAGYGQHSGLTEEQAREIRVRALRFVLDCYEEKKKATRPGGPDNAEKESKHVRAKTIISE